MALKERPPVSSAKPESVELAATEPEALVSAPNSSDPEGFSAETSGPRTAPPKIVCTVTRLALRTSSVSR